MKTLNLQPKVVVEMSQVEMAMIDGGSWLKTIYEAVKSGLIYDAICSCVEFFQEAAESSTNVATNYYQQCNMMRGH
ncbi:MAG: hypothetical protein LBJ17_08005 [Dysgonamonadaceae bacterium]|jgi:hypothetical protein|nr:hypothetical protein [Dysgonamonadaceae bacterium]